MTFSESKSLDNKFLYAAILTILVLYPLRWTFTGLDLWDSGYNCLNYVCFGPQYMNPALFYSTFLACAAGRLFSLLPFGNTYAGLRFYCGLIISANVLISSLFCLRRLRLNKWTVLFGELLAVSLCYSPTVVLYNHLSFLLLTITIILLYNGLAGDKNVYLVLAGFILGLNVYVRFPNITQAVLVFAVWFYLAVSKEEIKKYFLKSGLCIGGWLASVALMYAVITAIYGTGAYISGITGLFGISEGAGDYSLVSMLSTMMGAYIRGFRRLADIAVFTVVAVLIILIVKQIKHTGERALNWNRADKLIAVLTGICLIVFFIKRQLMQFDFHHYITVVLTAAMFIDAVIILCAIIGFRRTLSAAERLVPVLLILQIVALSVGSNTGISPVMNSMFLMAPFMLHYLCRFIPGYMGGIIPEKLKDRFITKEISVLLLKTGSTVLTVALLSFYVQCVLFGAKYVYEEAQNGRGGHYEITGNRVLAGTKMAGERAKWIQGLTDYIYEEKLVGEDVIVYGYAPSLVYYLSLKPVIGSWPDLDSYATSSMRSDMTALEEKIDKEDRECPIVIFDNENIEEQRQHNADKWKILDSFMDKYDYSECFSDGRFSLYRSSMQ